MFGLHITGTGINSEFFMHDLKVPKLANFGTNKKFSGEPETVVVVTVVRPVPVTVCSAQVPVVVVPRTTAQNAPLL